jgi:hypothetical protein
MLAAGPRLSLEDAMKHTEGTVLEDDQQDETATTSTATTVAKKYRVQLDFSQRDFREIELLVDELGLSTRAELFRSALVTLRWMVQKKQVGCTIVAVTPDDRLLEPEFEFLQGLERPQGAAATVHKEIKNKSEEVVSLL